MQTPESQPQKPLNDSLHVPGDDLKPPKGVGISSKLFFILAMIAICLVGFVMVLIFSYRSGANTAPVQQGDDLVAANTNVSAAAQIEALNRQAPGLLIGEETAKPVQNAVSDTGQTVISVSDGSSHLSDMSDMAREQAIEQAARSQISVVNNYSGPSSADIMSDNGGNGAVDTNDHAAGENALKNGLSALASAEGQHNYQQQNMQGQKVAFLKAEQAANRSNTLDSQLTKPLSPYEITAGSLIPAVLLTGIDSDLPGQITAIVSRNVDDSVTGNYCLIPQGTKIIGVYDSQVAYGQSRVLIAWQRLIFPNGDSFDLLGQPGVDLVGMAGLHDLVNNHYTRIFGSALAFSLFGALGQLSQPKQSGNATPTNAQIIYGAIGQNLTQAGVSMIEANMNIQPTIKIRPGAHFNVLLTRDMVFPGASRGC